MLFLAVFLELRCPTKVKGENSPMDCSLPGSSVPGISQARVLEWIAISFYRDLSDPGMEHMSPALAGKFFTTEPPGKPHGKGSHIESS